MQGCEQSDGVALLIIGAQEQLLENVASIKAFQNFYNALIHRLKSRSGVSRKKNQLNGSQLDFHLVRRAVVDEEENLPLAELKFSVEFPQPLLEKLARHPGLLICCIVGRQRADVLKTSRLLRLPYHK